MPIGWLDTHINHGSVVECTIHIKYTAYIYKPCFYSNIAFTYLRSIPDSHYTSVTPFNTILVKNMNGDTKPVISTDVVRSCPCVDIITDDPSEPVISSEPYVIPVVITNIITGSVKVTTDDKILKLL